MFDKFFPSSTAQRTENAVVVIGLGRFGGSLATELMNRGTDVMGIDMSESIVQSFNGKLTSVVRADSTDEDVLRQLGVDEFDRAVVGIGSDIQASILVTSRLLKFNCPEVWAKAITAPHAEILEQLGVHHVVNPERDMGVRTAHLIQGRILDFVPIDQGFAMVRCNVPASVQQRPMDLLDVRRRFGVAIVAVCRPGGTWEPTEPGTMLYEDDQILLTGPTDQAERFSSMG